MHPTATLTAPDRPAALGRLRSEARVCRAWGLRHASVATADMAVLLEALDGGFPDPDDARLDGLAAAWQPTPAGYEGAESIFFAPKLEGD